MSGPTIEALEARLHEPLPVRERVKVLSAMAEQLYERDCERGAQVAREAVDLARATADALGEAHALYGLGRNLYSQADYPAVLETQGAALALFRSFADVAGEARCLNLLGITHRQLADYGRALEMYDAALAGFREAGERQWQARVISNIGNVEIQLGNHAAALELFERALELRREIGDHEGAGFDLNNAACGRIRRALELRAAGDRDSCQLEAEAALRLLDRALAIARQFGYRRLEAFCLQTMGEAYQAMARPQVALGLAAEFLALAHASGDKWIAAHGLACVGELRHQTGEHQEALAQLAAALAAFEALGARDQAARVLRLLSQAHEALEQLGAALACIRQAGTIEERLRSEEAEARSRALATRRRLDEARRDGAGRPPLEDALTGLANRRQLDQRLESLLREVRKHGGCVTVALADVDHFEGINDRFSRAVGDEVLRCVGEMLRGHCRLGDLAGRYGGQEFLLVLRGLEMRAALETCERVRRAVESWDWKSIHPQLQVTLSMGLASSSSLDTAQGLLDAAGHWLYEAKHHGRNQVQPLVVAPA